MRPAASRASCCAITTMQTRLAIIEVWETIEAHQASVARIPPDLLKQAQTLLAEPVRGAYYDPVTNTPA